VTRPQGLGQRYRILVFPGGTEIGLEIASALGRLKEVELFSAGSDVSNHAPFAFARHHVLPTIDDPTWLEHLNDVLTKNAIDYIFPAYDDVLLALAENTDRLAAGLVTSPLETCRISRSKSRSYTALADVVPVPAVYFDLDAITEYPVFTRPDRGQGSLGAAPARDADSVRRAIATGSDLVTEYLPGDEFTVDCFSDREGGLLYCGGRRRVRVRAGISMHSETVVDEVFNDYALRIASRLEFHGAWFFQLRNDRNGVPRLLEVAPRIAGTSGVQRVLGVNLPLLSIYEQERVPFSIVPNRGFIRLDRALINRYQHEIEYDVVYFDLDDTLLNGGSVDTALMKFIFQCINQDKRLVLLTRHEGDLAITLSRHRLAGLWDEVIHLKDGEDKADHISPGRSIFFDDSFAERQAVRDRHDISTFDGSMVELLIDDRV
jgi:carbamoyl-phosphate synthase large subunit